MIKKILISFSLLLVAALIGLNAAGISPAFIYYGPGVASGIGAKLLCSAEYVIGNERDQAFDDLVQYSPILSQVTVRYNDDEQSVTASLFGLEEKTATYIPGLGCAVDYPDYSTRRELEVDNVANSPAPWPRGESVTTIDDDLQSLLEELLAADNAAGLNTRALLLVHAGQIKAEAYGQGMNEESRLLGWSMAKSLNAIMLGNLEMRGLIDLESTPGFSAWSGDARANIAISDMLTMTDGLEFSEQYNPGDDATAMLFTVPSTSDYVLQAPLVQMPQLELA